MNFSFVSHQVRKKTLSLALDLVTSRHVEEMVHVLKKEASKFSMLLSQQSAVLTDVKDNLSFNHLKKNLYLGEKQSSNRQIFISFKGRKNQ